MKSETGEIRVRTGGDFLPEQGTAEPGNSENDGILAARALVGGKWKILIVWVMKSSEKMRFSEIRRSVPGINDVMLSQSLKELTESGIVVREPGGSAAGRQSYRLTELGASLVPVLQQLDQWGKASGFIGGELTF